MPSQMHARTVAPHKFQLRRCSLGEELRLIANRSGQTDTDVPLSPIVLRKRSVSVDNSQLDKCPRTVDNLCCSPPKASRLPSPTAGAKRPCSLAIKSSSLLLRRMASDNGPKSRHLQVPVPKFMTRASSPKSAKNSVTRSQILAAHKAMSGIPGLGPQSSQRTGRTNPAMLKYTTSRNPTKMHPIATNQPTPIRLSMSPTPIRDPTFNAFGGLARVSSAALPGMPTSPIDPTRTVPSVPGNFSRSSKNPLTPQNLQAGTQYFPVLGSYLPTAGNIPGYYYPTINSNPGTYYTQFGNPVGPFYAAPLQNSRQYHQTVGTNGTSLGSYYDEGLMQAGPYVGSLIPNNISPALATQNNQFYYQMPVINSTNDYQYITANNPNVRLQNPSDQTAWNYMNRAASPNQTIHNYNNQGKVDLSTLPLSPSGNAIQRLQAEGAGVSPFQLGQFVYQTPLNVPIDNNSLLYQVQPGYQANGDCLNMGQAQPLSSPKPGNTNGLQQTFPFLLSDMRPSPRKKMATLLSQTTERPGIHPTENQWIARSLSQYQKNFH